MEIVCNNLRINKSLNVWHFLMNCLKRDRLFWHLSRIQCAIFLVNFRYLLTTILAALNFRVKVLVVYPRLL